MLKTSLSPRAGSTTAAPAPARGSWVHGGHGERSLGCGSPCGTATPFVHYHVHFLCGSLERTRGAGATAAPTARRGRGLCRMRTRLTSPFVTAMVKGDNGEAPGHWCGGPRHPETPSRPASIASSRPSHPTTHTDKFGPPRIPQYFMSRDGGGLTTAVADMAIKGADATAAGLKTFWDGNRRRGRSSRPPPSSCILHS
jgi:hypothetical protein